ncbi:hypothetical protein XU18_1998 [Perkinsela sp. CCAP 1560/4]|nr:hypothetical protein XU18_1998 [Perkinsela sp. CCAP 1560/4]|eukprot:KNH07466.1 hypothetical protein XU18_1998 [Perkinsela sp. CCAP 1560/4]
MCFRIAQRLHSALYEGYFTGSITSFAGGKGSIMYTKNAVLDELDTATYQVLSPETVNREGLREMFPDYYPCVQNATHTLNIPFNEKSLAKNQEMRGIKAGMRVRFDVVQVEGDRTEILGQPVAETTSTSNDTENQGDDDTVGFHETEKDHSIEAVNVRMQTPDDPMGNPAKAHARQRKRKVYHVRNMMVISSGTHVPSHAAWAKPRSQFNLL